MGNDFMQFTQICSIINATYPIDLLTEKLGLELNSHNTGSCPVGHPSESGKCFRLNKPDNYAHCFNCGKTWSVIDLYMEVKKVTLPEAVSILGQRLGYSLSGDQSSKKQQEIPEDIAAHIEHNIRLKDYYFRLSTLRKEEEIVQRVCRDIIDNWIDERIRVEYQFAKHKIPQHELEEFYFKIDDWYEFIDRYLIIEDWPLTKDKRYIKELIQKEMRRYKNAVAKS
jgi:hypothetical protein